MSTRERRHAGKPAPGEIIGVGTRGCVETSGRFRRRGALGVAWTALAVTAACGPSGDLGGAGQGGGAGVGAVADAGSVYVLPAGAPDRFGFGSAASTDRIARWDIDVKPDGEGLPEGRGTVAEGERVYMTHCVSCHGPTGTEGPYDRLVATDPWEEWPVRRGIGNYWPYATTLYDYIGRSMPQLTPGILSADETYAVIAYLLERNGIVGADAVMDAATLPAVIMPARSRFVPDDRQPGPGVR